MPTYRLHAHDGDDLGLFEHPAPNLEPGDVVMLPDGREALVTARLEATPGRFEALLEVVVTAHASEPDDSVHVAISMVWQPPVKRGDGEPSASSAGG